MTLTGEAGKKAAALRKANETRKRNRENALELERLRQEQAVIDAAKLPELPPLLPARPVPVSEPLISMSPVLAPKKLHLSPVEHLLAAGGPLKRAVTPSPSLCHDCGMKLMSRGVMKCAACHSEYHNKCSRPVPNAGEKRGSKGWTCHRCRK